MNFVSARLEQIGAIDTQFRGMTENGNSILDTTFEEIPDDLERRIKVIKCLFFRQGSGEFSAPVTVIKQQGESNEEIFDERADYPDVSRWTVRTALSCNQ